MSGVSFDRDDLLDAMGELARRVDAAGVSARIHVIGGAALAMGYYDRIATQDVDCQIDRSTEVLAISEQMAYERAWPTGWLNEKASMFLPIAGRRTWRELISHGEVHVMIAPADLLLAMKLNAARPGKDLADIDFLVEACGLETLADAEDLFDRYYPGEVMRPRARAQLAERFGRGD